MLFTTEIFEKTFGDKAKFDDYVENLVLHGYRIKHKSSDYYILKENNWGSIPLHFVLYFFFLLILALTQIDTSLDAVGLQYIYFIAQYIPVAAIVNLAYIIYSLVFANEFRVKLVTQRVIPNNKGKFCKECGAKIGGDEVFCTNCGTKN